MKQVSGSMKLDLAQYREMAAFAQFASDLDASTKNLLDRGARLTELLKQPVYHPLPVEEEVVSIFAGVKGFLDKIALNDIKEFEQQSLETLRTKYPQYLNQIKEQKIISEELEVKLKEFYKSFTADFISKNEKAA